MSPRGFFMKRVLLKIMDALVRPFDARVVRNDSDEFRMKSALRRIVGHGVEIDTVIDIGASDGKWSLEAMEFFPGKRFFAVEPLTERETALENLKRTRSNFDYELCVAGEIDGGAATLNVAADLDGSTVGGTGGTARRVTVRTVDAMVAENGLEGPFLLKFDTHGYDLPILSGSKETLLRTNLIIMETYNFNFTDRALRFHETCFHMEKLGFRCYDLACPMLRVHDRAFWQVDMFFCRSDSKIFAYRQYA